MQSKEEQEKEKEKEKMREKNKLKGRQTDKKIRKVGEIRCEQNRNKPQHESTVHWRIDKTENRSEQKSKRHFYY